MRVALPGLNAPGPTTYKAYKVNMRKAAASAAVPSDARPESGV
ncbi:hypothetical protein SGFS_034560 [Streptomyces graminofaciens]|uniref:Uncharacterized protein n=1 Tax=Streptomyces graminofaciens TaxID=68212 RepID=A0ABM7F863_9ACTN|nr:hypothetical protein SGFS_034560 [Streptomyces graminofaciens]